MTGFPRTAFRLGWLIVALLLAPIDRALAADTPGIGFQLVTNTKGDEYGIWYPSNAAAADQPIQLNRQMVAQDGPLAGHDLPLVVISHGNGGSYAGHFDTAIALARAGFVVAALTHPGDNWRDQSRATDLAARPRAVSGLIDYMLGIWPGRGVIDAHRIGAFGFSSGGFTVLTAAGATPDLAQVVPHCRDHAAFFDCMLLAAHPKTAPPRADSWPADKRIRALVVAAPALGFTFGRAGLHGLTIPVQLWRAAEDHILPHPFYAEAVAEALPTPPDYHVVPDADHFDFLAPCSPTMTAQVPMVCHSAPGFDRTAFHRDFNAAVVAFFARSLR